MNTKRKAVEKALSSRCGGRGKGNGFMANGRGGAPECARSAWAGHSADTGLYEVVERQSQGMWKPVPQMRGSDL